MKATGKQWNDFLASWPEDWWYDDADLIINGISDDDPAAPETPAATDRIDLTCGVICDSAGNVDRDLVREFRKWIKAQTVDTFLVEVPKTVDRHYFESRLHEMFGAKVVK